MTKLKAEENAIIGSSGPTNAKRGTVDVHRGGVLSAVSLLFYMINLISMQDHYQFAYFLRKVEPHSVIVKVLSKFQVSNKELDLL